MRATNCQSKEKEFPKTQQANETNINFFPEHISNGNIIRSSDEKKPLNPQENETLLKNKRLRNAEKLDINKQIIQRNINVFINDYSSFLNNPLYGQVTNKFKIQEEFDFINENRFILSCFYQKTKKFLNYGELIAQNFFNDFAKESNFFKNGPDARKVYDKYLFHFVELKRLENNLKNNSDPETIQKKMIDYMSYDPSYILQVPIIECDTNDKNEINDLILEGFNQDLVILRGFLNIFGFNPEFFTEKFIVKTYKDQKIEVIEQTPNFFGFSYNFHQRYSWTLEQYGRYLEFKRNRNKYLSPIQIDDKKIDEEKIYFGVNLDMDHMEIPREEIRSKINPLLNFCGFDDSLSYLRETIKGMNLPQFYIKEKGVWTGGHEENCRIRSININHGPQGSEWYGVRLTDGKIFSDYLKKKHNVDIYIREGIWYENWEYFLKNKLYVLYTVQQAGDIILVGPGCIHWVRSLGNAVHSSWNFFPKEKIQIETALERFKINRTIKMRSLVPMYNLMIDILNFEMYYLDLDLVKYCYSVLKDVFKESNEKLYDILGNPVYSEIEIVKEDIENLVVCELCYDELFNFWSYAEKFSGNKKEKYDAIMCSACFEREFKNFDFNYQTLIGYKYEIDDIKKLFERIERRIDIEEGRTIEYVNEFQPDIVKFNQDTIFNCKIKKEFIEKNINDEKLTVFLNKKNPIFERITAKQILDDVRNNFKLVADNKKPNGNSIKKKFSQIKNEKLLRKLKGNCVEKEPFSINEEKNYNAIREESKNKIDNNKTDEVSENDTFCEFLEKSKFKLVDEFHLESANLGLNNNLLGNKHIIEKINKYSAEDENINASRIELKSYDSKIIIHTDLNDNNEEENQRTKKEIGELIHVKEKDEETISNSGNHNNLEDEHSNSFEDCHLNKSFDQNISNYTFINEKQKEHCDLFEVNLSNFEIADENNNEKNKFLIIKNNFNINISKMNVKEFINHFKRYNEISNSKNFLKNSDFQKIQQKKKYKNPINTIKKHIINGNPSNVSNVRENTNVTGVNNIVKNEYLTIPTTLNLNFNESTINLIKDKIGEQLFQYLNLLNNNLHKPTSDDISRIISLSDSYFDSDIHNDDASRYVNKNIHILLIIDSKKFDSFEKQSTRQTTY